MPGCRPNSTSGRALSIVFRDSDTYHIQDLSGQDGTRIPRAVVAAGRPAAVVEEDIP